MELRLRGFSVLLGFGLALGCSVNTDEGGGVAGGNGVSVLPGGGQAPSGAGASSTAGAGNASAGGSNGNTAGSSGSTTGGSSLSGGGASSAGATGGGAGGASSAGSGGAPSAGSSGTGTSGGGSAGKGSGGSSTGGSSSAGSSNGGSSGGASDPYGDARTRCVNRTNELRATKGLGPIPILPKAEPCADGQAKADSISGMAHSAFAACLDQVKWKGAGQNECPGYGSVEDTLTKCLDAMWAEGPGGGHYDNMVGNSTHTACGFYTTPAGKVWMVQDFWTE